MATEQKGAEVAKLFSAISAVASESPDFSSFLSSVSPRIAEATGFDKIVLAIPHNDSEFELFDCERGECALKSTASAGSSFQAAAFEGRPISDFSLGKFSQHFDMRKLFSEGYKSCITFPFPGKTGALSFIGRSKDRITPGEEELLRAISGEIGLFVKSVVSASGKEDARKMCDIVFESSSEAVFITEPSGKIASSNARASDLSGFPSEELSQRSIFDFYPESREAMEWASRAKGGGMQEFISLFRKRSGENFVRTRIRAVKDGKLPIFVFSCIDTTEGLLSGAYEGLLSGFGDITFAIDSKKSFISLSGNVGQSLGYSADELIGEPFATIVASKDNSLINEIISWAKDKKKGIDGLEIRLVSKSGSVNRFLLGARVFFDSGGNLMRIHGILRDIEQVKKASGQEIFYSEMLEDLSDAVWGSDEGGYIRYWNKSAEKLLGYQKGEILGKDAHVLFPPEKEWELSWALGGKGFAKTFESQRAKKDGGAVDFRVASKLVKDAAGNTIGYIEILKDVELERKFREAEKAKKRLDEDYKQLRRDNQLGADFVSSVSHEIRTPLTNIHGYSLLIQEESGKLSPEHKKYIDIIASETDRLRRLVNEVLDISKLDSFRFKPDMQEMHLNSLQDKCSCAYLAEGKGLYVNWEFEEGLPPAYADPIRISQVLINLISNAIKFTEKGGITVRAYRKKRSFIQVDVTDTGEGIPPDEQKNIFKRFHQASAGKKREGTGLGLAIAEQIVKVHGGRLWLESSKVGEGSTFSFTLPTKKRQPRAAKKKQLQVLQQAKAEQVPPEKTDAPAGQKEQPPAGESQTKEKDELPASETESQKQ